MVAQNPLDGLLVAFVKKPLNVGRDLADEGGIRLEVQADHIKLLETPNAPRECARL